MAAINPATRLPRPLLEMICDQVEETRVTQVSRAFRDANRQAMIRQGNRMAADPTVGARFLQVLAPPYANLDRTSPAQISACFAALYRDQRPYLTGQQRLVHMTQHRHAFSLSRFQNLEAIASPVRDRDLQTMWDVIHAQIEIPCPPTHAPANQIRTWMHDPQNAESLRSIQGGLGTIRGAPPAEILLLTELTTLYFEGLEEVPRSLTHFTSLQDLAFSECPGIRTLPDEVFRHVISQGWRVHLYDMLNRISSNGDYRTSFGISPHQLTDIPFALWFNQTFSIPYIRLEFLEPGMTWLEHNLLGGVFLFAMLLMIVLIGAVTLPSFLINLFLLKVVEPIVTCIRDLLGYSRMVHVRDQPQGEM
jgi:hypothetical protein